VLKNTVEADSLKPSCTSLAEPVDEKDVLDKGKMLEALAALRHAKWFQVGLLFQHLLRLLYFLSVFLLLYYEGIKIMMFTKAY